MKFFITGISSGIGRELTKQLVRAGHEVWGVARRTELLDSLRVELDQKLLRVSACDLNNLVETKKVAQVMERENFFPDVVILNAGVFLSDLDQGFDFEKAQNAIQVNVLGAMFWIYQFLPKFLQRKEGLIIGISSTSSLRPSKKDLSYSASKAALSMIFRGLRLNFTDSSVRFITVNFGPINTALWQGKCSFLVPDAHHAAQFIAKILNKRSGIYYFPFWSTLFLRLIGFMPDKSFSFFARFLR